MQTIFLVRIQPNPEHTGGSPEEKKQLSKGHHDYIESLSADNTILMGGSLDEMPGGLIVVNLPSKEEVEAKFSKDPMVSAGYLKFEVWTWNIKHNQANLEKIQS